MRQWPTPSRTGAITAFELLLADRILVLGPDHPDTLATRGNLQKWLESLQGK